MDITLFYNWHGLNVELFHLVNRIKEPKLDVVMLLATFLGDVGRMWLYGPIFLVIAAVKIRRHFRDDRLTDACLWLVAVATLFGALALDGLFLIWAKGYFDFPRPALALGRKAVEILGPLQLHHSFPSGHASFALTLAASLWIILPQGAKWFAGAFVCLVAVSRVYVGAHFPADVIAGLLSSLIIVLVVRHIALIIVPALVRIGAGRKARAARLQ